MKLATAASAFVAVVPAYAEIVAAAPDHMTLRHAAVSEAPPAEVWARLIEPSSWWSADHTYWGDADALSLELSPGGAWSETGPDGATEHGRVLYWKESETLRLTAPFGPFQGMAVETVWTITLAPDGEGTRITSDFVANGTSASRLDAMAGPVDGVFGQAIRALSE